jgi:hypothetical protein
MTRARIKALHDKVNSILATLDLDTPLDGMLPHAETLCVIRYKNHQGYEGEEAPFIKEEEAKANGLEEEERKKEEEGRKKKGQEKEREEGGASRPKEAGTSRPMVAGASTLAGRWPKPGLAARERGRPVVPAPPGRYYRRELGGTSPAWSPRGKEEEAGTLAGTSTQGLVGTSGQGTARGTAGHPSTLDMRPPF